MHVPHALAHTYDVVHVPMQLASRHACVQPNDAYAHLEIYKACMRSTNWRLCSLKIRCVSWTDVYVMKDGYFRNYFKRYVILEFKFKKYIYFKKIKKIIQK